jgi:hypothetical protein
MKEFSARGSVSNTVFFKSDLLELEQLLTEDVEGGLHVQRIILAFEEGRISVTSLSEVSDDEYKSFKSNPKWIDIVASGWKDRHIWRHINVEIFRWSTKFSISGDDQIWVLGRRVKLLDFIKARKKHDYVGIALNAVAFVLGVPTILIFNRFVDTSKVVPALLFMGLWILGVVLLGFAYWKHVFKSPSKIYLRDKESSKVDYQVVTTIIGIVIGALVTIGVAVFID